MLELLYVCVAFFVVALVELSPKLYCHDVAFVLVSVTYTVKGGCPLAGVTLNPAIGKIGIGVGVGVGVEVSVKPTVTCFVVVEVPFALMTVCIMV